MGQSNRGFTLLEMLTTVAILGIGSTLAVASWGADRIGSNQGGSPRTEG